MAATSKQKGAAFEREVCTKLSLWVTDGTQHDLFWRSAMSGGRATVAYRRGIKLQKQAGDIVATDRAGNDLLDLFIIECKFYKDLAVEQFIYQTMDDSVWGWWLKLINEARKYKKAPIMIAKQNRRKILMITNSVGFGLLGLTHKDGCVLASIQPNTNIIDFEQFLDEVPYEQSWLTWNPQKPS